MKKNNVIVKAGYYIMAALIVGVVVFELYLVWSNPLPPGMTSINTCISLAGPGTPSPCGTPTPTPPWWEFWNH